MTHSAATGGAERRRLELELWMPSHVEVFEPLLDAHDFVTAPDGELVAERELRALAVDLLAIAAIEAALVLLLAVRFGWL